MNCLHVTVHYVVANKLFHVRKFDFPT